MKILLLCVVIAALQSTLAFGEPETAVPPAQTAFESVQAKITDKNFSDSVLLLKTMTGGFKDMEAFLRRCDDGLISPDEEVRSTAFLCAEAINALRQAGQLSKWAGAKQAAKVDAYDWKNGEVIMKFATDESFRNSQFPTYHSFQTRAQKALENRNKPYFQGPSATEGPSKKISSGE